MIHQRAGRRMREDHRRLRDVERVAHDRRRDVREVHQHPEPVHLADDLAPEIREPAVLRAVERGVGPVERHVVRERHVPRAERVVVAQRAQRILDGVPAFQPEQRPDLPRRERRADVGRGRSRDQRLGILRDHPARDVDLFELHARIPRVAVLARDVHRPELATELAGPHSRRRRSGVACASAGRRHRRRAARPCSRGSPTGCRCGRRSAASWTAVLARGRAPPRPRAGSRGPAPQAARPGRSRNTRR